jgi:hypothetical protein
LGNHSSQYFDRCEEADVDVHPIGVVAKMSDRYATEKSGRAELRGDPDGKPRERWKKKWRRVAVEEKSGE